MKLVFILFLVIAAFSLLLNFIYRRKKFGAKFIISARNYPMWIMIGLSLYFIALHFPLFGFEFELLLDLSILLMCFSGIIFFASMDILVLEKGIWCFMNFIPWETITSISETPFGIKILTHKRLFKRADYLKFIWKIQKNDLLKLSTIKSEMAVGAEQSS